jgi:hypothetical protein
MPTRGCAPNLVNFSFGFLHAILTEVHYAGGNRVAKKFGRMRFAYGNKLHIVTLTTGTLRGRRYARPHVR